MPRVGPGHPVLELCPRLGARRIRQAVPASIQVEPLEEIQLVTKRIRGISVTPHLHGLEDAVSCRVLDPRAHFSRLDA